MANQRCFYATKQDLVRGLRLFESRIAVRYYLEDLQDSQTFTQFDSLLDYPKLGLEAEFSTTHSDRFLVLRRESSLAIETVPQHNGTIRYQIHQGNNPASTYFTPGGLHQGRFLIAGQIGNCSPHPTAKALFQMLSRSILRGFKHLSFLYYASPEALKLRDSGIKLTDSCYDER